MPTHRGSARAGKVFYVYDANDFLSRENVLKLSVNALGTWSFVSERGGSTVSCFLGSGLLREQRNQSACGDAIVTAAPPASRWLLAYTLNRGVIHGGVCSFETHFMSQRPV